MTVPIQQHHRLAVLRIHGYSEEWLAADGREKHHIAQWAAGKDHIAHHDCSQYSLWDRIAQALADAEAFGRGERTAHNEGVQRIVDRVERLLDREFGVDRPSAPPPSSSGLVGAINDVYAFHDAMDMPCLDAPQWPGDDRAQLRYELIREEFLELQEALGVTNGCVEAARPHQARSQLCLIADAIGDLIYVLIGTALEFGLREDRVWVEIQQANMRKVGGPVREDGKRLKPEGWVGPDIEKAVFGPKP